MKRIFTLTACLLSAFLTFSQPAGDNIEKARIRLAERGEIYFTFQIKSPPDIEGLSKLISIDNLKGDTVFAYANSGEFSRFLEYTSDFELLTPPSELITAMMTDNVQQVLDWNYYPTYPAYESLMTEFAASHPEICKLITIANLASGRKILALKITDNPDIQEPEPEFLYTSSIHGDETTGYVLMLHLIDYLLNNYGTDQRVTDMINSTEIYINPLANPDGTYKGGNSSVNGATRGNANNIDLNRNYPDPEDGQHPDGNAWQPETVAFMNFAGFHHFTMAANFHGGTEVLNYPWDTWSRLAADNNWWVYVCREYADTVHLHAPSNYMNEYQNGITNGFAWYTISGGRQDYMNYFRNCREVTIEISDTKLLSANLLENHWEYNYRSFLNYIEQSNYGLHGIVTDSITGIPLYARVFINGHDLDSSHVFTDFHAGDYHRLLKAGSFDVSFSSPGYYSKTVTVQVNDKQKSILDIQLYDGSLKTNFSSNYQVVSPGDSVGFSDRSAGDPDTWYWEFEGGVPSSSTERNPAVLYPEAGTYRVKLLINKAGQSDSLSREDFITVKSSFPMGNAVYEVCDGLFLDSGGALGAYAPNESSVITFKPGLPDNTLKATFIVFNLESSAGCINDRLNVYDGTDMSAPLLGSFCGSEVPGLILASNSDGALTFEFNSNGTIEGDGWAALLQCDSNVGIENVNPVLFSVAPNPVSGGYFRLKAASLVKKVIIFDLMGRECGRYFPHTLETYIPAPEKEGIYIVKVLTEKSTSAQRIVVVGKR